MADTWDSRLSKSFALLLVTASLTTPSVAKKRERYWNGFMLFYQRAGTPPSASAASLKSQTTLSRYCFHVNVCCLTFIAFREMYKQRISNSCIDGKCSIPTIFGLCDAALHL
jgi:hypothetical protein